jgi:hypothetical protein
VASCHPSSRIRRCRRENGDGVGFTAMHLGENYSLMSFQMCMCIIEYDCNPPILSHAVAELES